MSNNYKNQFENEFKKLSSQFTLRIRTSSAFHCWQIFRGNQNSEKSLEWFTGNESMKPCGIQTQGAQSIWQGCQVFSRSWNLENTKPY